jgi:hypothetical protein
MSAAVIRELTGDDVQSAFTLSSTAGWNQRPEDWRTLLGLAPHGSFTAIVDGRLVGTAIGINYRAFGWIAMMLVDPAYRGRGLGGRLLEAAMQAVPSNLPIRLDATPLGRPLYERYGFVEETALTRMVAHTAGGFRAAERADALGPADLGQILDEDARVFGADRRSVFDWSLTDAPYARIVRDGDRVAGYSFGRRGRLFDQVGPVIARNDDIARTLVSAAIAEVRDRAVAIDAYDRHERFSEWLRSMGFHAERPLFRMSRGAWTSPPSAGLQEYSIFGPDFG